MNINASMKLIAHKARKKQDQIVVSYTKQKK